MCVGDTIVQLEHFELVIPPVIPLSFKLDDSLSHYIAWQAAKKQLQFVNRSEAMLWEKR